MLPCLHILTPWMIQTVNWTNISLSHAHGQFLFFRACNFCILKSMLLKEFQTGRKTDAITCCASIIKVVVFLFCFLKKPASEGVSKREKNSCHYELRVHYSSGCIFFLLKNVLLKESQTGSKTVVSTSCALRWVANSHACRHLAARFQSVTTASFKP